MTKSKEQKRASDKEYRSANKERIKKVNAIWIAANKDRRAAHQAAYRKRHPGRANESVRAWAAKNPDVAKMKRRESDARNVAAKRARSAGWRSRARRVALWADKRVINDIYAYAKIMRLAGIECHVDHDVPLKGALVSGLHVESNLTVLSAKTNMSKHCKFEVNP